MIYTPLTQKAMKFAYEAHHGQMDMSGVPYIFHSFYVAESVSQVMEDEIAVSVALLHDVVEDTEVTLEQLEQEFPKEVTELVELLTHDSQEDYFEYVRNIRQDPIAIQVKAMDICHNMDETRLSGLDSVTEEQKEWWHQKYDRALGILLGNEKRDPEYEKEMEEKRWKEQHTSPISDEEVYQRLGEIQQTVLQDAREVMKEHRFEVFSELKRLFHFMDVARNEGLDRLCAEAEEWGQSESELARMVSMGLVKNTVLEGRTMFLMLYIYDLCDRDMVKDYIMYIYLRGVALILAGTEPVAAREVCLSLLPSKDRILFEKISDRKE